MKLKNSILILAFCLTMTAPPQAYSKGGDHSKHDGKGNKKGDGKGNNNGNDDFSQGGKHHKNSGKEDNSDSLVAVENDGVVELDLTPGEFSRIVALSDVHGMLDTLKVLLAAADVTDAQGNWNILTTRGNNIDAKKTLLIVVGDSIDKGPESLKVLSLFMELSDQANRVGGRVIHLLGNHEAEFMSKLKSDGKAKDLIQQIAANGLKVKKFLNGDPMGAYLRSLPLAARVGNWFFAHAGFYQAENWSEFKQQSKALLQAGNYSDPIITGNDSVLEAKDWWKDESKVRSVFDAFNLSFNPTSKQNSILGVVFGHQHSAFGLDMDVGARLAASKMLIKLDSGMPPIAGGGLNSTGQLVEFAIPEELSQNGQPHLNKVGADGIRVPLLFKPAAFKN